MKINLTKTSPSGVIEKNSIAKISGNPVVVIAESNTKIDVLIEQGIEDKNADPQKTNIGRQGNDMLIEADGETLVKIKDFYITDGASLGGVEWNLSQAAAIPAESISPEALALESSATVVTEEEAAALVQSLGGVAALVQARLGEPMPSALARPGDVGLVELEGRQSLAVCIGRHWQAPGPDGLRVLPRSMVQQAWGVGL